MRERKYVKFRVDMYHDTKFKIIDMKPERDLIHYVWTRIVVLAGKVNLEGDLYLSKNIPYTVETLAIEFNRDAYQIKLALDVFIELEMIEFAEDNIYRVKNFAKHQNIKVKEKIESNDKKEDIKIKEVQVNEKFKNEICDNENKKTENKTSQNQVENDINHEISNLVINNDITKSHNNMSDEMINTTSQNIIAIPLEKEKNKPKNKEKKKDNIEEKNEDNITAWFDESDGGRPLAMGERVAKEWSF